MLDYCPQKILPLQNLKMRLAGAVAQLVEHRTENPGVDSSILSRTTA